MTEAEGRTLSSGDLCPVCSPVGNVYLGGDGYLACNNCMWNSEEDAPKSRESGRVLLPRIHPADGTICTRYDGMARHYCHCPDRVSSRTEPIPIEERGPSDPGNRGGLAPETEGRVQSPKEYARDIWGDDAMWHEECKAWHHRLHHESCSPCRHVAAPGRVLSPALLRLGQMVVAEHPVGHRVVGEVRGFGLTGAILYVHSPGKFQPAFLSADDGWTFTPQEEHPYV